MISPAAEAAILENLLRLLDRLEVALLSGDEEIEVEDLQQHTILTIQAELRRN